jgi:hypothetical protein
MNIIAKILKVSRNLAQVGFYLRIKKQIGSPKIDLLVLALACIIFLDLYFST